MSVNRHWKNLQVHGAEMRDKGWDLGQDIAQIPLNLLHAEP
jgi:hypothetical protein